ncbi:MAG: FGGY-family carbohydrate kinase [Armatimonadota bacterium]
MHLGIDLGTGALKIALFSARFEAEHLVSVPYSIPAVAGHPEWAQADCDLWLDVLRRGFARLSACVDLARVRSVGISTLFPAAIAFDERGEALHPAILYSDTRSAAQIEWLREAGLLSRVAATNGQVVPGTTTLTSLLWLRDERPAAFERASAFGHANTFVAHWLTGNLRADTGSMALSGLLDTAQGCWDVELARAVGIPPNKLPDVGPAGARVGEVTASAAAATGLPVGTPVAIGSGDALCATLACGAVEPGDAVVAAGTTDCLCLCLGRFALSAGAWVACHPLPGRWIGIAATSYTGGAVGWLAAILGKQIPEVFAEAANAPAGARGVLFAPYLRGERSPILSPEAKGAFVGLTDRVSAADLSRAVLEGAAFALRHNVEAMEQSYGARIEALLIVGGPAASEVWNQVKADVCGRPIRTVAFQERSVLGAALLGAIAADMMPGYAGWSRSADYRGFKRAFAHLWQTARTFEPDRRASEGYQEAYQKYLALHPAMKAAGLY